MEFGEVALKDGIKDNLEEHIGAIECESGNYKVERDNCKERVTDIIFFEFVHRLIF